MLIVGPIGRPDEETFENERLTTGSTNDCGPHFTPTTVGDEPRTLHAVNGLKEKPHLLFRVGLRGRVLTLIRRCFGVPTGT